MKGRLAGFRVSCTTKVILHHGHGSGPFGSAISRFHVTIESSAKQGANVMSSRKIRMRMCYLLMAGLMAGTALVYAQAVTASLWAR